MKSLSFAGITALALALASIVVVACMDDLPMYERCNDIPAGGCPGRTDAPCADPACAAVFTCLQDGNGAWEKIVECGARDAGAAGSDADAIAPDASGASDAGIDAPPGANGGPGCAALQAPECSLGLALACARASTRDCCGCEDLFVCENGGWSGWGVCESGGVLRETRRSR